MRFTELKVPRTWYRMEVIRTVSKRKMHGGALRAGGTGGAAEDDFQFWGRCFISTD